MKRVGILRGGTGHQYHTSLKKGGDIILYIHENLADKYKPMDILIDQDYIWHLNGIPINPGDLVHKVDMVWNTSHPSFSNILDSLSIPHVSSGSFSGALENSSDMLRNHIKDIDLQMPRQVFSPKGAREVFEKFGSPWIVKIYNEIKIAKTFNELTEMLSGKDNVIVEEFIAGKVAALHSVAGFRGEDAYTFPLGNMFGNFSSLEKEKLTSLAQAVHAHVGAKQYLKSHFILTPRGKVYLTHIESTPDVKLGSHFHQACELVGTKMHSVIEHILERTS